VFVKGLTKGTTYSFRSRVLLKAGGAPSAWSVWADETAGDTTAPAPSYSPTASVTAAGILLSSAPTSAPSDLSHYEFHWNTTNTAPGSSATAPNLPDSYNGQVSLVFADADTAYVWIRAVDTSGNKQAWTSLGGFTSDGTVLRDLANNLSHGSELIPNPGFELGIEFWKQNTGVSVVTNSSNAHSGNKYLQIVGDTGGQRLSECATETAAARYIEVNPGDIVKFGGWIYREGGAQSPVITIEATDKDKASATTTPTAAVTSAAWTKREKYYVVAAGKKYIRFYAEVPSGGASGSTCRFDDMALGIVRSQSTIQQVTVGNRNSAITGGVNPVTAADVGSTATISVASFILQYGFGQVNYNSGSITGLNFNTKYFVYCDDAGFNGGAVTYVATTAFENVVASEGRVYVGSITTPINGGGDTGGDGGGGGCPTVEMWLTEYLRVENAFPDALLDVHEQGHITREPVITISRQLAECVTLLAQNGCSITVSVDTPFDTQDGRSIMAPNMRGGMVLTDNEGVIEWSPIREILREGKRFVARINLGGRTFAAGIKPNKRVFSHNLTKL